MKPWLKNVIRKQRRQRRRAPDIDYEGRLTDPLEWSNLIAERVGYARYTANKKNEELSTEETHKLIGGVIREVQEEILSDPDLLALYLGRAEAEATEHALTQFLKHTGHFVEKEDEETT